ncbi:MAG: MliC family protein [Rhodocyclales bacterium]|nr:MliC family protein [Rhodocyclales bacterium]
MQKGSMSIAGAGLAAVSLLLAGCGDMNVKKYLPFGDDTVQERSRTPPNSTEYQCAAGKRFYVRTLEGGAAVWLILPERELRLARLGSDTRYSNGIAVLELNGNEATLTDGAASPFTGCKASL